LLTTGHLPSRHPVVVGGGRGVGGWGGGGGGSRARPAAGRVARRGGPAPALAPFPVPGRCSLFALLRVACHCWGLTLGCLRASPGGRPQAVAVYRGRPSVDARRLLYVGFRQCGSFVEVYDVDCVLSLGGWLVLVRAGVACRAVCGCLRSGAALVDVRLDVVPLTPRSSSQTVAGCLLGGYPAGRDQDVGWRTRCGRGVPS
jgi:hypothetical protein